MGALAVWKRYREARSDWCLVPEAKAIEGRRAEQKSASEVFFYATTHANLPSYAIFLLSAIALFTCLISSDVIFTRRKLPFSAEAPATLLKTQVSVFAT